MTLVSDIMTGVYSELSVAGSLAAQTYADDKVLKKIEHKFKALYDRLWWPQFMTYGEEMVLDGSTGVVTTDLSTKIYRWQDIQAVYYEDDQQPLPVLQHTINPNNIKRRMICPVNTNKRFKVIPIDTAGSVFVNYRTTPIPDGLATDTDLDFDDLLLIHGVCYDMLTSDGDNPADAEKYERFFNARFDMFAKNFNHHGISLSPMKGVVPTEWQ